MLCQMCGKNQGSYSAIVDREVLRICENCARTEGLPIVRKPTEEQLARANQRYTVKERMMKLSGMDKLHPVSRDHEIAQRHLGKIRVPEKAQTSASLVDNYNWNIKIARRRRKVTLQQLSVETNIPVEILDSFEKGMLVKDYEKIALKLENALTIPILKDHEKKIHFIMPKKKEELVEEAKNILSQPISEPAHDKSLEELELAELRKSVNQENVRRKLEKGMHIEEIKSGNFDFSDKKKSQNVTLNDLIEAKMQREKLGKEKVEKSKAILGDDLELEE